MVQRILRIVLALLIPLAVVEAWRVTPGREDGWRQMDFAVFYTAGRMFTSGTNPYVRANAEDVWKSAGGDPDDQPGVMDLLWGPFAGDENNPADRADHWLPVEVVPPGLTVMTPFSLLPAGLAWPAWNYVVLLLFVGQLYATVRLMRRPLWDASSLVAILFTILLEPLHIGLANGQPTVPTVSLLVLALYWATNHRQDWAGVAFAVATRGGHRGGRAHADCRRADDGPPSRVAPHLAGAGRPGRRGGEHRQRPRGQRRPGRPAQPGADRPPVH
jgi:hypothetical protein